MKLRAAEVKRMKDVLPEPSYKLKKVDTGLDASGDN